MQHQLKKLRVKGRFRIEQTKYIVTCLSNKEQENRLNIQPFPTLVISMQFLQKGWVLLGIVTVLVFAGCSESTKDEKIRVTLLQINDVYEIEPVSGGKFGGLARVATLRKELLKENPNTFTFIAGDFLSPSALGTAQVEGKALDGQQMVAVLNAMGMDYATFGNHEFDIKEEAFFERMAESRFTWISNNVFGEDGKPFEGVKSHEILTIPGSNGSNFRLGVVGVTIEENKPDYVTFEDPFKSVLTAVHKIEKATDAIVAITHLDFRDDMFIAKNVPEIDLIIGGHDHENMYFKSGENYTPITKADLNAKTAFVHKLTFDPQTDALEITSTLVQIDDSIEEDPPTKEVVEEWVQRGFNGFRKLGFNPSETVATINFDFDGRESSVRSQPTNLTRLIADAMLHEANEVDFAFFNGGSIRIDDKLMAGPVTQYDIIRVLPFPGKVVTVGIQGNIVEKALDQLRGSVGNGAFLQTTANVNFENNTWTINGNPIETNKIYRAATNDFIANGRLSPLNYLNINQPDSGITLIETNGDVRIAVINELKRKYSTNN